MINYLRERKQFLLPLLETLGDFKLVLGASFIVN